MRGKSSSDACVCAETSTRNCPEHGQPELIETIKVYRDNDGTYAATWSAGGTWDARTPGHALVRIADALDAEDGGVAER